MAPSQASLAAMAPFVPASFRGRRHAATPVTISSSGGSHRPVSPTVIDVPSDSDEATSRPKGAARRRRPSPPPPSPPVVSVRSPVDVIDIVDSSGDEAAAIRPRKAAARRRRAPSPPSSPPAVSVRSPAGAVFDSSGDEATSGGPRKAASRRRRPPSQPSISAVTVRSPSPAAAAPSAGGENEATSAARKKKKKRYKKWGMVDERAVLCAMADLSERNLGVLPPTSKLVTELLDKQIMMDRHDVHASLLSSKIYQLKRKFSKVAVEQRCKSRRRNSRKKALYEASKKVWPKLYEDAERARAGDDGAS